MKNSYPQFIELSTKLSTILKHNKIIFCSYGKLNNNYPRIIPIILSYPHQVKSFKIVIHS
nr:MAG TPA: hypothetical protein [Caudoviricetes sp.]